MTTVATITRAEFEARLEAFLKALQDWQDKNHKHVRAPRYSVERGQRYIRVVEDRNGGGRSVYCFLDYQGNVYKSESWKRPAKHIRGSILKDGFDIGCALTQYGAVYLK